MTAELETTTNIRLSVRHVIRPRSAANHLAAWVGSVHPDVGTISAENIDEWIADLPTSKAAALDAVRERLERFGSDGEREDTHPSVIAEAERRWRRWFA